MDGSGHDCPTSPWAPRTTPNVIAKNRAENLTFIRLPLLEPLLAVADQFSPKQEPHRVQENKEFKLGPFPEIRRAEIAF
jgi:hypothetical protein